MVWNGFNHLYIILHQFYGFRNFGVTFKLIIFQKDEAEGITEKERCIDCNIAKKMDYCIYGLQTKVKKIVCLPHPSQEKAEKCFLCHPKKGNLERS